MKNRGRLMTILLIAALCVTLIGTVWASENTGVMDAVHILKAAVWLDGGSDGSGPVEVSRAAAMLRAAGKAATSSDADPTPPPTYAPEPVSDSDA